MFKPQLLLLFNACFMHRTNETAVIINSHRIMIVTHNYYTHEYNHPATTLLSSAALLRGHI